MAVSKPKESVSQTVARAKAMLSQTKSEGSKSFKGSSYEKDYKAGKYNVITSDKIKPTTPITLPTPSPVQDMSTFTDTANANLAATSGGTYDTKTNQIVSAPTSTEPNQFQDLVQQYLGSNAQAFADMPTAESRLKEQRKLLKPKETLVNSLQGQLNTLTSRRDQEILKLEGQGRGQTEGFIGGEQARIGREAAIQAMPIQAQLAIAQDDLESARSYASQLFQAQSQDALARYNYQKDVNGTIFNYLNEEQKRALASKEREEDRSFQVEQSNRNNLKQLSMQAIEYGQGALAGEFMRLDPTSPTYNEDVADAMGRLRKPVAAGTDPDQLYSGLSAQTAAAVRSKVGKFSTEPIVQNFATIQEGYNFVQSLSDDTTNPADDQALIYALAKTLDPGSVVREGEYATAQKYAQSWIKAFGTGVEQAIAGTGFLSKEARENIKNTIESRYNASKTSYENLYTNYTNSVNSLTGRSDGDSFLVDYATPVTPQQYGPVDPKTQVFESVVEPEKKVGRIRGLWNWLTS
jgi:hypothetical protein